MPLLVTAVILLVLALGLLPSVWVQAVMARYGRERPDFPGTGGELARHLLDREGLGHVGVEATSGGDHYDSRARVVRLLPQHLNGRSLAAVAIAAHEVGHALQDRDGSPLLRWRATVLTSAMIAQRAGLLVMIAGPALMAATGSPAAALVPIAAGWLVRGAGVVAALSALPSEYDASFRRALPILSGYLGPSDLGGARRLLRAAAFTYVAAALRAMLFLRGGPGRF